MSDLFCNNGTITKHRDFCIMECQLLTTCHKEWRSALGRLVVQVQIVQEFVDSKILPTGEKPKGGAGSEGGTVFKRTE